MTRSSSPLRLLSSPAVNTLVGVAGVAGPAIALIVKYEVAKNFLLIGSGIVIVLLVAREFWQEKSQFVISRGNPSEMSDSSFFRAIEKDVIHRTVSGMEDLADGFLRVYASEVPYTSLLLFRTLAEGNRPSKQVLATDLTQNPGVLLTRREYLMSNQNLIRTGGSVQRVFICRADDLISRDFARDLLALAEAHRAIGVVCGLAVRDMLKASDAVDYVVFDRAAVLVEEEQGDVEYKTGRSMVHFRRVETWTAKFHRLWETNETPAAVTQLSNYEFECKKMMDAGTWNTAVIRRTIDSGQQL